MHWTQFVSGVPFSVDGPEFRCSFDLDSYKPFEETAHHEFAGVGPFWERSDGSTITFDLPRSTVAGPAVHVTAWGAHAAGHPRTGLLVTDGIDWIDASTAAALYERPYADGIIRWTRPIDAFEHPELGIVGPFPLHRLGTHSDAGFLWASGPGFAAGARDERSALDLPPTILAALDAAATLPAGTPIG